MKKNQNYFTMQEKCLWSISVTAIVGAFVMFDAENYLTLGASLVGVTSLILNAKGHPLGQLLMVMFSLLYGVISYRFSYYGEMITYLAMTLPMSVFALISWVKHPYQGDGAQVRVGKLIKGEAFLMWGLTGCVTFALYFVLEYFHTSYLPISTISVTTSFLAVYLTLRRSRFFALGYAANDVVLIVLWSLASVQERCYLSVVVCFAAFFVNDLYTYLNWKKMEIMQMCDSSSLDVQNPA